MHEYQGSRCECVVWPKVGGESHHSAVQLYTCPYRSHEQATFRRMVHNKQRAGAGAGRGAALRDVVVLVGVVLVSLHVVAVDQGLDALLQVCRLNIHHTLLTKTKTSSSTYS